MNRSITRVIGAAAAGGIAAIHLLLAPEYLGEKPYIGLLFVIGGIISALVATELWRIDHTLAWATGTLVAVGMAAGLVLSRTVGLPGFHESDCEPSAVLSLALEVAFVATALHAGAQPRRLTQRA